MSSLTSAFISICSPRYMGQSVTFLQTAGHVTRLRLGELHVNSLHTSHCSCCQCPRELGCRIEMYRAC